MFFQLYPWLMLLSGVTFALNLDTEENGMSKATPAGLPEAQGLYSPGHEHDACGVGFVVDMKGRRSHAIVAQALEVLKNLLHRGACGCEVNTGDGAGILIQIPHAFLPRECATLGITLPAPKRYGAGLVFLPRDAAQAARCRALLATIVAEEGQTLLGWRPVPTDDSPVGPSARAVEPTIEHVFIGRGAAVPDAQAFERKLYVIRKRVEHAVRASEMAERGYFYLPSLSANTLIYKGMLSADQIETMFPDITDPLVESALALVHQRFSTDAFPSWPLAHPYRYIAHNGEINTLRGNINWMHAREAVCRSALLGNDIEKIFPIVVEGGSDSAVFDNVLEFLVMAGRPLPLAVLMMIPEAWSGHESMSEERKAFYEYHGCLMEPWDGPASIAFTDGRVIGAVLDRNGLRPSRYYVTRDGLVIMASEVGVLEIPDEDILVKERLHPGRLFLVDTVQGRIVSDDEVKRDLAAAAPYGRWLAEHLIDNEQLARLRYVYEPAFRSTTLPMLYDARKGGRGLAVAMDRLKKSASDAVAAGYTIIILSDRGADRDQAPIPSLLATAGVHHHLVRHGTRTKCGLVVESGDAREVHHCALLLGYGAGVVNPYLAFETLDDMIRQRQLVGVTHDQAVTNYIHALNKGILKVMSKMGISTLQGYCGAQIFEAVGLDRAFIDQYFTWTASRIGGVGIDVVADEVLRRHAAAFPARSGGPRDLESGGEYQWRRDGEYHLFNPDTVFKLQHATRSGQYEVFKDYTRLVDDQHKRQATLRGLLELASDRQPIPIDDVEPVEAVVRRFATGAMSYGSISQEAHETLAIAMNRIGGKSNTGEGGEDPARHVRDANGDWRRSAVKQVASARFGVTSEYLVNAEDLQIKMAQGAKPGEGGQLPGHKVYPWIAKVRYATPGVGLISPPPHHDIYSIEDLAELIYDLKNANPRARISVKLVAVSGVGTIAAGVAKAHADVILISGHDGGTGASPLTSIKHGA